MFIEYPDVLTVSDAEKALGVSDKTVYRLIESGKIKHFRVGKLIKIPKPFLVDYVETECYNFTATGKLPCQERSS